MIGSEMIQELRPTEILALNLSVITLHVYKDVFILEADPKVTNIKIKLQIDRTDISFKQTESIRKQKPLRSITYSAFLGVLQILKESFLVFVARCSKTCSIEKADIFEVTEVIFVRCKAESQPIEAAVECYVEYIRSCLLVEGFYFSYIYDLSLSRQAYAQGRYGRMSYFWNAHMGRKLLELQHKEWFVGLMQGSIRSFTVYLQGQRVVYFLLTRRSHEKGGTRYNARGIDSKGNVANFCQTEQLLYCGAHCCSHVQIRGSVPAFWKQSGIYAEVRDCMTQTQFYGSHEETQNAFLKHFSRIEKHYERVMCINLLSRKKTGQDCLNQYYEELVENTKLPFVRYCFFDLHLACKGQRFERANYLVRQVSKVTVFFGFFYELVEQGGRREKTIRQKQHGVMRTNCLDCLDRTNLVQSRLAYDILMRMLARCGIDMKKVLGVDSILQATEKKQQCHPLIDRLKNVWADNGDLISKHYTGTGSTHTNVTRTGRRDLKGVIDHGYKTLNRFYQQYMEDNYKQEAIDILLGKHTETINLAEFETLLKASKKDQEDLAGLLEI